METKEPRPNPQDLVSQDGDGLWMKMDSNPETDPTKNPLMACGEKPQDETNVPAVINRYYSVMDDEGADDVFIPPPPPPPPYLAPLLPTEGSTDAQVNTSRVTLTNGPADATEAKANPSGLDWHHGEKQLMAEQNEVDEVVASAEQTSEESMDTASLSKDEQSTLSEDPDQKPMEETCYNPSGRRYQDNSTGDEDSSEEPEDIASLSKGRGKRGETEAEKEKDPKEVLSSTEEDSEDEMHFYKDGESKDIFGLAETDSKPTKEHVDCNDVGALTASSLYATDNDFEPCRPPELCKTSQPQVPEIPTEESNDDEMHVDTRSLDYTITKHNWVRRESGTGEMQGSRLSFSEGSEEQGDGGRRIATEIQQGEQLLQRLQMVQLRQDECIPESAHTTQQGVQETSGETTGVLGREVDHLKARKADLTDGDEKEMDQFHTAEDEEARTNLMEKEKNEKNGSKDVEAQARTSKMPVETEHHMIAKAEARDSDDDQIDSWVRADLSPNETSSTQIPFLSPCHRLSVVETSMERHIHEETPGKQSLQRAGGVFNLADNPDVLEIPFKTNISLEPLPAKDVPEQRSDWQFSEQKMKKEISQEIQRELVLVNQGKIPGGYSKGEVRQLKETKLLFEAFQQDNTEGPTRLRKPPTSVIKGRVYPSVLERTKSLEMLSLKTCPVSRAHSLRLYKETEKSPEILRSLSPTGGSRDKTRLSPYLKPDKHTRLCRSMDSISTDVSTSAVDTMSKTREGSLIQGSSILKGNPFFKLRPALALQPEVEKDIREAKEREEELRRQRCTLYGEKRRSSEDGDASRFKPMLVPDVRKQSRGKLERVWPPPSKKDQMKSEQTQQEPKVHRAGGQRAPLWQRWESGLINGKPSKEKN